jgi:hypothetical protein
MSPRHAWVLLLLLTASSAATEAPMELLGCSHVGQRPTVLVLAAHGASSYVKLGTQRIAATLTSDGQKRRWRWANGSVVLGPDGLAEYFEGPESAAATARLRCKPMGG